MRAVSAPGDSQGYKKSQDAKETPYRTERGYVCAAGTSNPGIRE